MISSATLRSALALAPTAALPPLRQRPRATPPRSGFRPPAAATASPSPPPPDVLPPPPPLGGRHPRAEWNAAALAYLGDGVWELYARRRFFAPPTSMTAYYASVVASVRAEAQGAAYAALVAGVFLTPEERDVLRWGRNATGTTPKRMGRAAVTRETYREATAVECLAGFLYLTDSARLHALMAEVGLGAPGEEDEASGEPPAP
jgi:ribonuclease-3 family protein